jgi:hypothetical protein
MALVYISSTYQDLRDYRQAAAEAIRRADHGPIGMEDISASEKRPLDKCREDVRRSGAYVGLVAWRYGFVPAGEYKSITMLEYEEAGRCGIPRLMFLCDDSKWPEDARDADPALITKFRERIREELVADTFDNTYDLKFKIVAALKRQLGSVPAIPELLPYRCDRTGQYEDFAELVAQGAAQGQHCRFTKPLLCFAYAVEPQAINRFLSCLREDAPSLMGVPANQTIVWKDIPWPEESSPGKFEALFVRRIASLLDTGPGGPSAALAELIDRCSGPVILHSRVYTDEWGPERALSLRALAEYWQQFTVAPRAYPLLLIVTIELREPSNLLQRLTVRRRNNAIREALANLIDRFVAVADVAFIRELEDVRRFDAEQWAETEPVQHLLQGADIREEVATAYGTKHVLPMRPLAKELNTILTKAIQRKRD